MKKYQIVLADCPWSFNTYSDKGKEKSPEKHYNTMTIEDIKNLPVKDVVNDSAGLYLWVPDCNLKDGLEVMDSWGFEYKSIGFVWYKTKKNWRQIFKDYFNSLDLSSFDFKNLDISDLLFRIGLGYNTRKQVEICLYGTTKTPPSRKDKNVRQVISAPEDIFDPIGQHSAKPEKQYNSIERLVEGPYLELFGRKERDGWTVLGDEIDGKDIRDSLKELKNV